MTFQRYLVSSVLGLSFGVVAVGVIAPFAAAAGAEIPNVTALGLVVAVLSALLCARGPALRPGLGRSFVLISAGFYAMPVSVLLGLAAALAGLHAAGSPPSPGATGLCLASMLAGGAFLAIGLTLLRGAEPGPAAPAAPHAHA